MKNFIIVLAFGFSLLAIGCRGKKEEKLVGEWKQIPFVDPETVTSYNFWIFYPGDALIIKDSVIEGDLIESIQYTYDLDGSKLRIFGDWGYAPAAGDPRGEYWIDQLNDDYLKMTKRKHPADTAWWGGSEEGAFLRIELVRQ